MVVFFVLCSSVLVLVVCRVNCFSIGVVVLCDVVLVLLVWMVG